MMQRARKHRSISRAGRVVSVSVVSAISAIAFVSCNASFPRELGDRESGDEKPRAIQFSDAGPEVPKCDLGPNGGVCSCLDVPLLTEPPNLYFILDRSGSMNESGKWDTVRSVVAKTVRSLGPRIRVGAAVFPSRDDSPCAPGSEVFPVRRGDSPAGTDGPTSRALYASLLLIANGGTPTASTLQKLTPRLTNLEGSTFVILATDGGPNCNENATCGVQECIANIEHVTPECVPNTLPNCCLGDMAGPSSCIDSKETIDAVKALAAAKIPVYVIGVPGSGPYAGLLDQLAEAGGTARAASPKYYRVDDTGSEALASALAQVAAKVTATCTFTLTAPPNDPALVNVYLDESPLPKNSEDGWTIEGTNLTLLGNSCGAVLSGEVLGVRIVEGCPTVLR